MKDTMKSSVFNNNGPVPGNNINYGDYPKFNYMQTEAKQPLVKAEEDFMDFLNEEEYEPIANNFMLSQEQNARMMQDLDLR